MKSAEITITLDESTGRDRTRRFFIGNALDLVSWKKKDFNVDFQLHTYKKYTYTGFQLTNYEIGRKKYENFRADKLRRKTGQFGPTL